MALTEASYKRLQGAVAIHYPALRTKIMAGGINLYTEQGVITVYFKREIYNHNKNTRWLNFDGLDDLFRRIDNILCPAEQKAVQEPKISQIAEDKGTLKCIEHIDRKIKYGEDNKLSISNLSMLKQLKVELIQYL